MKAPGKKKTLTRTCCGGAAGRNRPLGGKADDEPLGKLEPARLLVLFSAQ